MAGDDQSALQEELKRRESELQRIDRQIDGLQHNLAKLDVPQSAFIGSGGSLAAGHRRRKELRKALSVQRATRGMILQQVRKAQERIALAQAEAAEANMFGASGFGAGEAGTDAENAGTDTPGAEGTSAPRRAV